MKGQKLFVRRMHERDRVAVRRLYETEGIEMVETAGYIGKLVGNLIVHVHTRREGEEEIIESILVQSTMRGKRVGRAAIEGLAHEVRKDGVKRLVVDPQCTAEGFFARIGFSELGGRIEKNVN